MLNFYTYYNNPELLYGYSLYNEFLDKSRYQNWWIEIFETDSKAFDLNAVMHIIVRTPFLSFMYASFSIKTRFPEGEQSIMKDPYYALWYAKRIIKGRWLEAEEQKVFGNSHMWNKYCNEFNIPCKYECKTLLS